MLELTPNISIPDSELIERFIRSPGPGGQNVNKVASAVELRFDVKHSPSLPEPVRERLLARRDRRLTSEGVLVIAACRFRDQARNRDDARERLAQVIQSALSVPKPRKITRPTKASKERRLNSKKTRSSIKQGRNAPNWSGE